MDRYIEKDGKKLRCGYTTGTCAAAASGAAAFAALTGGRLSEVKVKLPSGEVKAIPVRITAANGSFAVCEVTKDSGDDPDVTNGIVIRSTVRIKETPGITIDGGKGVGRVTKPGLDRPVGEAAINTVPRKMIEEQVLAAIEAADRKGGADVIIEAVGGEEIAEKTFNPRLGIEGGISILGTSGIVEPMSDRAIIDTIKTEISMRRASGLDEIVLVPGNYGADFARETLGIKDGQMVMTSNFIGDALREASKAGFVKILLVGHIGKLVKLAGGMMNTHSKYGDCRMEIICANAAAAGLSAEGASRIMTSATCDEAVRVLKEEGIMRSVMDAVAEKALENAGRCAPGVKLGIVIFSKVYGILAELNADTGR